MDRYMVTLSGKRLYFDRGMPTIDDIFLNHCRTPMYCAHTEEFMSVGHHVLGSALIAKAIGNDKPVQLLSLLHEAEVVMFGNIPGPSKIKSQRMAEKTFRNRFFQSIEILNYDHIWDSVEFVDKLEQWASCQLYNLPERVYEEITATDEMFKTALEIVADVKLRFPPYLQLALNSNLFWELKSVYGSLT